MWYLALPISYLEVLSQLSQLVNVVNSTLPLGHYNILQIHDALTNLLLSCLWIPATDGGLSYRSPHFLGQI